MSDYQFVIKKINELTTKELYDILKLRQDIFVVEQNCPYHDIDDIDLNCTFLSLYKESVILATTRVFYKDSNTVQIGRVCTREHLKGYGKKIMEETILFIQTHLPHNQIYLEGQTYAIPFYESFHFKVISDVFYEDNIPHVKMINERD